MIKKTIPLLAALAVIMSPLATSVHAESMHAESMSNQFWWPDRLDLNPLREHDVRSNPLGADFDYAKAFSSVDLEALKADIAKEMTTSQAWWPGGLGHLRRPVHSYGLA